MPTDEEEIEKRAQLIFEAEGNKDLTWHLIATKRVPGAKTVAAISEAARKKYREQARRELRL